MGTSEKRIVHIVGPDGISIMPVEVPERVWLQPIPTCEGVVWIKNSQKPNTVEYARVDPPAEQWIFTFGFDHTHPVTGERLAKYYVAIEGDVNTSREVMAKHFGNKWSMQYPSREKAGVEKYGLERIDLPDPSPVDKKET